jgi:hypothetical protein
VNDAGAMGAIERVADLDAELQNFAERQRAAYEAIRERLALEQLHDQKVVSVVLPDVVEGTDVRMVQLRDRSRLALETDAQLFVAGEFGRKDLDRDAAIEARIARAIDLAHSAGAERP